MRDLIRPSLFMLARLGLFLVVAACIAGQWNGVMVDLWFLSMAFDADGIGVACTSQSLGQEVGSIDNDVFAGIVRGENLRSDAVFFGGLGGGCIFVGPDIVFVVCLYWFIVPLSLAINVLLIWLDRRSHEAPADV